MPLPTADLCDAHGDLVAVAEPVFRRFGARASFAGPVATVKVHEDNVLVKQALAEPGRGRVLVVDGGGSPRCALLGDNLAKMGADNGWAGIVVFGMIRDSIAIDALPIGVRALGTCPRKSAKRGTGSRDVDVTFAGVTFAPGAFVYADEDGLLVAASELPEVAG
jgi:regulator of ribonuclease activity A